MLVEVFYPWRLHPLGHEFLTEAVRVKLAGVDVVFGKLDLGLLAAADWGLPFGLKSDGFSNFSIGTLVRMTQFLKLKFKLILRPS